MVVPYTAVTCSSWAASICAASRSAVISAVSAAHPDVTIHCAALDRQLNERGYILPGLGDAGDRQFGTGQID